MIQSTPSAEAVLDKPVGAMTVDVEEWFHAHNLSIPSEAWETLPSRVEHGVNELLSLFSETKTTATFFVLGWVAQRQKGLIRRIRECGHEIACHGQAHRSIHEQSPVAFRADIRRAKSLLEDLTGRPARGYRAPNYSVTRATWWALEEIRAAGFAYDSSIYPVRAPHGRYGIVGMPKRPFEVLPGLWEYPLPVVRLLGKDWPAATGAYLRLFPMAVHRLALRQYRRRREPLVLNVHPWELDPHQPRRAAPLPRRVLHYSRLAQTRERLRDLLERAAFTSIESWEGFRGKAMRRENVEPCAYPTVFDHVSYGSTVPMPSENSTWRPEAHYREAH